MSITFSYRALTTGADEFDAWYTDGSKSGFNPSAATSAGVTAPASSVGLIGDKVLENRGYFGVAWQGENIFPSQPFSILVRRYETSTSLPSNSLFYGQAGMRLCTHEWYFSGGQFVYANVKREQSGNHFSGLISGTTTLATTGCHDYVLTCPGTNGSTIACYHNGTLISTATWTTDNTWATTTGWETFCNSHPVTGGFANIEEMVIWNEVIDPTNITLVTPGGTTSTGQTLNGPTRTGWVDVKQFEKFSSSDPGAANVSDGTNYVIQGTTYTGSLATTTDPGAANVLSGTAYLVNGVTTTGTYHDAVYTDPGIANVLSGTGYTFNDSSLTGTYSDTTDPGIANVKNGVSYQAGGSTVTGTLVSTDPGASNVANGTNYIIESTTYTGSAVVLSAGTGASGTLDINSIKENIQTILEEANTTTASPVDLSANLSNSERIRTIGKFNPDKIPREVSAYPMVTVWIDGKSLEHATIARNQKTGKRKCEVDVKVMGMVFNPNWTDDSVDPADEDINYLMENIELTLRAFPALGGNGVLTSFPDRITYYRDYLSSEDTHVRAGVIDLRVTAYY